MASTHAIPASFPAASASAWHLARALAIDPRVLLLDEPFGALDAKVRKELRRWLRELHDHTGYTTIFVTHDRGGGDGTRRPRGGGQQGTRRAGGYAGERSTRVRPRPSCTTSSAT